MDRNEALREVYTKYKRIVDRIEESERCSGSHFLHIVKNRLMIYPIWVDEEEQPDHLEWYRAFRKGMVYLKRYLNLLEKYPDFREGEMRTYDGFYPDIRSLGGNKEKDKEPDGGANYTIESEKRLRNLVQNN